jgi:hypothetical protein
MIDRDVSDALTEHVWDELAAEFGSFVAGTGGRFERACNEDAGFGEDDDDGPLLVKRLSDGALFAVQLRALAVPLLPAAKRQDAVAELSRDSCWVLWGPCGCAFGVTTATLHGQPMAVTAAEAWMSLHDDWGLAERNQAAGYRIELMTFSRFKAEVRFRHCPHQPEPSGQMTLTGETAQ